MTHPVRRRYPERRALKT